MGPIKRSGSLTRFFPRKSLDKTLSLEALKDAVLKGAFVERSLDIGETNPGWALHGNEMSTKFDLLNTYIAGYAIFSLRIDRLHIDQTVMKMRFNSMLASYDGPVSVAERAEIKEAVLKQMAGESQLTSKIHTVIVDKKGEQVFFSGSSDSDKDTFYQLFSKCFGIDLLEANAPHMAFKELGDDGDFDKVLDDPASDFHGLELEIHPEFEDGLEGKLGSSFLTWLFYKANTSGEIDGLDFQFMAEDPISFAGESLGTKKVTLSGGLISKSLEMKAALGSGKRVSEMKLTMAQTISTDDDEREDVNVSVCLDKTQMKFSKYKIPKPGVHDQYGKTIECLEALTGIAGMVDELFAEFIRIRYTSGEWEQERGKAIQWIESL